MKPLIAAAFAACFAVPVWAGQCGPLPQVIDHLGDKYGETQTVMGLAADQSVLLLFANRDTGSWTIVRGLPNGMACLLASGEAYTQTVIPSDAPA